MGLDIPRRVWLFWDQGLDLAPSLVRSCVESWVRHNPDWEVTVLSGESLCDWGDPVLCEPRARSLLPYRLSELARLSLLLRHGGVWADATAYCMKPLDEWLPAYLESGFFAFANPAKERLIASWFLASSRGGYVPGRMWQALSSYYLHHNLHLSADELAYSAPGAQTPLSRERQRVASLLPKLLNRNVRLAQLWLVPPLPQLGLSPYFSFHYMFARLVRVDPTFRAIWDRTIKVDAYGPHGLHRNGLAHAPSPDLLAELADHRQPVYKLDWRYDPSSLPAASALNVLFDRY